MPATDTETWIAAVRSSHDRLAGLLAPLTEVELAKTSGSKEWTIADVASHLGSQAEIFGLFLGAGLRGEAAPGGDVFGPIWDRWNAMSPTEQSTRSVAANKEFVETLEGLTPEQIAGFSLNMFGADQDIAGFAAIRHGEHAVHTWDVAVGLDPAAVIAPDAVELLIDRLNGPAGRARPVEGVDPVAVRTTDPTREFVITLSPQVTIESVDGLPADGMAPLALSAENMVRLVYGRLAPESGSDPRLAALAEAFPGF